MRIRNLNKNLEIVKCLSYCKTVVSFNIKTAHVNHILTDFIYINNVHKRSIENNLVKAVLQYKRTIKKY